MNKENKKNKRVLITGGAGYIGSHTAKLLREEGYETFCIDNLSLGDKRAVIAGSFQQLDLNNPEALCRLFSQQHFDAVVHFAAFTDVGESCARPLKYYRNNVANTLNLLEAMVQFGIKTFIFSSSAAVYGFPETETVFESHPCRPISPYGTSKLMTELMLADLEKSHGLRSASLRYFNAAGGDPDGTLKYFKQRENNLIPIILRSIQQGRNEVSIFGTDYPTADGTCIRDYIHVHDLAWAHQLAMEQLFTGAPTTVYNLGNGNGYSVREVIAAVQEVVQVPLTIKETARRPGDPPILVANASKAQSELNWHPRYPELKQMIADAWRALQ